jgi:hypothetical protein
VLPIEARRAAWDALWKRLLAEPEPDDSAPDTEPEEVGVSEDEAA